MDYEEKLSKAKSHADKVKLRRELSEIWHSNDEPREKLSFSKMAFIFMITNCTIIEIYALAAMFYFGDLSSLSTLITSVVGECISFVAYEYKSMKENSSDGIVYETAMKKLEYELNNNDSVG